MAHEVTVDDSKARRELGYTGAKTIEQGLAEMRGSIAS
jgi:nucleoside-diphosphate-sugar epimerase